MKKFVEIDLDLSKLVHLTPPHAPVLVTTISPFGNFNIGSFEQFMTCSNSPARIVLGVTRSSDTFRNILEGSDFCVGIPTITMIREIYRCGEKLSRSDSEFDFVGLTQNQSQIIKSPQILECSVNLECTLYDTVDVGDHSLLVGDVVYAVIDESRFSISKVERRLNLNAPYYVSSGLFFQIGQTYDVSE